jgi:acetyl esterase/lipase
VIDWDDAFDNSGYIAGSQAFLQQWADDAAAVRKALLSQGRAELDQDYGASDREVYDFFRAETQAKGTVVFVHGGYWLRFDKSDWSHLAQGCLGNGWDVAIPSYPLAPDARIGQMTEAVTRAATHIAARTEGPIALIGHSAGGHLVSRLMCQGVLPPDVAARISRVVSVSGVHHLDPLLGTKMNAQLQLTPEEVAAESPVHLDPMQNVPVTFVVGDQERPEFLRQTRMLAERWGSKAADVRAVYDLGTHHFDVIASLADVDGMLTQEVLR